MISYVKRIERIRIIVGLLLFFGALCCYCLNISASEQVTGSLQTVTEDIVAYDSMDVSSGRVDIKAGEIILVADEDSEWLHVLYQGSNLYIKKTDASAFGKLENEDAAKELEKTAQMDKSWIESYIVQMKAIRSGRIWRTVIAVMIVAVIVFIVMNSIRRNTSGKIK
ncbi:hypothetical protein SAMN02910451_00876 [Butyrivibrio hungatei]|uniref:Uncharacterized protein n=1 Tax=Butyrivibrio hungatei TaxID=185008 RepID=A0A1G5BYD2_9FIRM|nr:hypothetical protein [Butyrivibrio hungatei]SCX95054.1 hypothetical protein SAMN02910451_00876 [Butyrivibrio hungatei]